KILSPLITALSYTPNWKQLLLGDSIKTFAALWNRIGAEFLWIVWKDGNNRLFDGAYKTNSLRKLFSNVNLQVHQLKLDNCRIYKANYKVRNDCLGFYNGANRSKIEEVLLKFPTTTCIR
ncbi:hypothetical protein GOP47_0005776, partial [Adiantum capillus-veneris]